MFIFDKNIGDKQTGDQTFWENQYIHNDCKNVNYISHKTIIQTDANRERDRQGETQKERQTEKQRQREAHKKTDRQANRERESESL